jgi:hypothetical protein|tara:strand:+ start:3061 stop:4215 length:1155 start_codon:yes stop_codon:yes gene_type:complete
MARNLVGKKYKDMPAGYRNRNSRADFREDRRSQRNTMKDEALASPVATNKRGEPRMAGDEVFNLVRGESFGQTRKRAQQVDERIERMQRRQDRGRNINEERLENRLAKQERLQDRIAAQEEFDGSIDSYNYSSFGGEGAGLKDIEYLSKAGFNPNEIKENLESRGINRSSRVDQLLSKYMNENMPEGIKQPVTDEPSMEAPSAEVIEEVPDEGIAFEPPSITDIDVNPMPINPGGGGGGGVSPTIATGVIGGDTGAVSLTDSSNYGTINTGIINDVRNYGGGYSAGSNNTGLAQAYVDLMEENLDKYSGDKYGMYITDSRAKKADDLRSINSNAIYGAMNQFAGNMYDRGQIVASNLYGDPYRFPTAQYGGFQDFSPAEEKEKA